MSTERCIATHYSSATTPVRARYEVYATVNDDGTIDYDGTYRLVLSLCSYGIDSYLCSKKLVWMAVPRVDGALILTTDRPMEFCLDSDIVLTENTYTHIREWSFYLPNDGASHKYTLYVQGHGAYPHDIFNVRILDGAFNALEYTKLAAPSDLKIDYTQSSCFQISWQPLADALYYRVEIKATQDVLAYTLTKVIEQNFGTIAWISPSDEPKGFPPNAHVEVKVYGVDNNYMLGDCATITTVIEGGGAKIKMNDHFTEALPYVKTTSGWKRAKIYARINEGNWTLCK